MIRVHDAPPRNNTEGSQATYLVNRVNLVLYNFLFNLCRDQLSRGPASIPSAAVG